MSTAMVYLLVACGGGIGALLRFCLVQMEAFPYGTLSMNVIGSFLMGLASPIKNDPITFMLSVP